MSGSRRNRPSLRCKEVFDRNRVADTSDPPGHLEPDALEVATLQGAPSSLTDTGLRSRSALRKALGTPPLRNLPSNVHPEHDSNHNLAELEDSELVIAIAFDTLASMGKAKTSKPTKRPDFDDTPEGHAKEAMYDLVMAEIEANEGASGGQRAIAERMGISQPALNQIKNNGKSLGLGFAIALRKYFIETGRPKSLDDLLGLEEAPMMTTPGVIDQMKNWAAKLYLFELEATELAEKVEQGNTRGHLMRARKLHDDIQRLREAIVGSLPHQEKAMKERKAS